LNRDHQELEAYWKKKKGGDAAIAAEDGGED